MQLTYLFYDIETSGLSKCFDQVLQFAAIRTDMALNELERHELLIKLNPDTILAPQAIITHQISLEQLVQGTGEYSAIKMIHQLLNTPGTISLGYNTLKFDDEFLRFSFYRNLLPPYTHQFANQCKRMDLYPMAVMYYLYKPTVITWPKLGESNTFKLEHLSSQNELAVGNAHEAMTDVVATLALARRFIKEREMWDYLCGYFDKNIDIMRGNKLPLGVLNLPQAILIEGSCGEANCYQRPVLGLGTHRHYKNQSIWLQLDDLNLATTDLNSVATTTKIFRKRFAEPPLLLPPTKHFMQKLTAERQELVHSNLTWLQNHREILQEIIDYHLEYKYPVIENLDVDAALYQNGFLSDRELALCNQFHNAELPGKLNYLNKFTNKNLAVQALRLLGRNYPEMLTGELRQEFHRFLSEILQATAAVAKVDYRNQKRLTVDIALTEIQTLRHSALSPRQHELLNELEAYLSGLSI